MAPTASRTRRFRSDRGAELVEFALVLPILLLVVLGIVDFGFLFQRMEVVTNAAREGARIGVLQGYTPADVVSRICNYLNEGGVPTTNCGTGNPTITVNQSYAIPNSSMTGTRVQVTYSHQYSFIGPFLGLFGGGLSSVPVSAVAVMRNEQ